MSSDGDDWFERAIDEDDEADGSEKTEADELTEGWPEPVDGDGEVPGDSAEDWLESDDDRAAQAVETSSGNADDRGDAGTGASAGNDDGDLFENDFASALEDADLPGGQEIDDGEGGGGLGMGPPAEDNGEAGVAADAFGMGGGLAGGDDDLGGGGEFGMGGFGGGAPDFDDDGGLDDDRIELGIEGLDAMIQGGVPERSLMVAIGSAGTGKTTFGLQFLDRGLQEGERAVFVSLEETRESIVGSAVEKGYPFDRYVEDGDLAIVDIDPVEMANSLKNIRSELPGLIQEFGASRLVLDSVSLLEMMYHDRAQRRNEIYNFTKSLKQAGVTTLLVSEASDDNPYASRYGIVEYLTDAVFVLQYVRPSDFRETRLAVEIQKIRDANHSRETKPYEITDEGIDVYRQANIF